MRRYVVISETAQAYLGPSKAFMGNMMASQSYPLPDGTRKTGTTCQVAIDGEWVSELGLGSVVRVEGVPWRVVEIEKPTEGAGFVTFERLTGAAALDFLYTTQCPECGTASGWTGEVTHTDGHMSFELVCPQCFKVSSQSDSEVRVTLELDPLPPFVPGRGRPRK